MKEKFSPSYIFLPLMVLFLTFIIHHGECQIHSRRGRGFVKTSGTHFVTNENRPLYLNGFNAYWLMQFASNPSDKAKVTMTLQQASSYGMNIARTWAFSDGGSNPLQITPGSYNENMFKGLDFVVSEAKKYGVYLILSFANNYADYGGKRQYVQWGRDHGGQNLNSEDDFYTNPLVKNYYKNHIKTILTRINTITGVAYKDEPTIFAWELMNEPRCQSDLSGRVLQDWIREMAGHVKSIDRNHLLEIGMEGFYGETMPERKGVNPGYQVGTDFISNNQIPGVDFATIHLYPDQWVPGSSDQVQMAFVDKWVQSHIEDTNSVIRKPMVIAEFGKSSRSSGYSVGQRDAYFGRIYNAIYNSARSGGSCAGGIFWQLMTQGMDNMKDGYEVVLADSPTTANTIGQQSHKLSTLT
ncbi:mannan endo-1,4-beta-mannosidase [Ranunculus cassubicifolius]